MSDSQWEKQYELSKKASTRSSGSSRSRSSSKKSGGTTLKVSDGGNNDITPTRPSLEEIKANIRVVQAPGNQGAVVDGLTNKKYSSLEALLNSYGYATAK